MQAGPLGAGQAFWFIKLSQCLVMGVKPGAGFQLTRITNPLGAGFCFSKLSQCLVVWVKPGAGPMEAV
ncbi:MAG: hypothetical protein AAF798_10480 [Bacteroidota bacterium]